ncbi:PRAME family member 12-like [Apodemus sylvaticus]|uniref:PRAME family member 12-like n=1 Tax=Apodemus sylvaticus TaxID=10129 RepID=UPI002241DC38|nr:PRAME family member 12-like [Apodemus sylvaticus]
MNFKTPPTIQQLAKQSLLKDEALTVYALKDMKEELFPPLFKDAFSSKQHNILRQMVAAWPFPCLPVGALMKTPDLETLKAMLDGLDLLMRQKVRPRRWNLQVLDLRDANDNFWNVWDGIEDGACPPDFSETQLLRNHPIQWGTQAVTVWINLYVNPRHTIEYNEYFYEWAKKRKDVQVNCQKVMFLPNPHYNPWHLLEIVEPSSIQELEVYKHFNLDTLAMIASDLGQMRNLQKFLLNNVHISLEQSGNKDMEDRCIRMIIPHFSKLHKLQHLYLNDVCFVNEHLDEVLRCLENPLETLAITRCKLSESDMRCLSQCPRVYQLKHLDLSGIDFINLSHEFLGRLLKRLTATLQKLELKGCMITDFQIDVLLPALSQCTQLTEVDFQMNFLSKNSLEKLLQHTANLRQLTKEMYSAPYEVYDELGNVLPQKFAQYCSELMVTLNVIRQPKEICFVSNICAGCGGLCVYNMEATLCFCWQREWSLLDSEKGKPELK